MSLHHTPSNTYHFHFGHPTRRITRYCIRVYSSATSRTSSIRVIVYTRVVASLIILSSRENVVFFFLPNTDVWCLNKDQSRNGHVTTLATSSPICGWWWGEKKKVYIPKIKPKNNNKKKLFRHYQLAIYVTMFLCKVFIHAYYVYVQARYIMSLFLIWFITWRRIFLNRECITKER